MSRATKVLLWLAPLAAFCATGYYALRLRQELDAERRFSQEKVASLLSELARQEQTLAVARTARNPKLVALHQGEKALEASRHNTLILRAGGVPLNTRLSATIFDSKGSAVLTNPTLSVQAGDIAVCPLIEGALQPGEYVLKLFHQSKVIASYTFAAR